MTESEAPKDSASGMSTRMGAAALMLAVSILLSRLLGFVRDVLVTSTYGASSASDAYYAAFTIPDVMNYFLAGGTLSITFIPLFSSFVERGDEEGGWRLFSIVATTIGALLAVATIALGFAAPWIVPLLFPGFDDPAQLDLTVRMTRIVLPAQLAFYIGGLLQATLFVREIFWTAAVAPLVYNACIIAGGVLLGPMLGIEGFSIGVLVGAYLGPLGLALFAARGKVRYAPRFSFKDEGFRRFIKLTLPLMLGASLVTVDEWIIKALGSQHDAGAITWLNHSRKLMMVSFAVIGQAAGQAALPYLSKLFERGDDEEMGEMLARSLGRVIFLSVVASVALIAVGEPLVWALYHWGEFGAHDAEKTARLLMFFAIGIASWAAQTLAVRGFYARRDTLTPMIIGVVVLVISAPIYFGLDALMGVEGLAVATTIGMTLNACATILVYRWRAGALPLRPLLAAMGRGLALAGAGGAAAWGARLALRGLFSRDIFWQAGIEACLIAACFALASLVLAYFLDIPELDAVWEKVRSKLPFLTSS